MEPVKDNKTTEDRKLALLHARIVGISNPSEEYIENFSKKRRSGADFDSDEEETSRYFVQQSEKKKGKNEENEADELQEISPTDFSWQKSNQKKGSLEHIEEAMRQKVKDLKDKLKVASMAAEAQKEELKNLKAQNETLIKESMLVKEREKLTKKVILQLLIETAKKERFEAKASHRREAVKLGHISTDRTRTVLREVWEEGQEFYDIQWKMNEIVQQSLSLKQEKEKIKSQYKDQNEEFLKRDEQISSRLEFLKRHKDKLSEEKKQYEARKGSHIRELKRILDEESSQFNKFQVLNERYSLLNLLGKGGFSEVFKAFDLQESCFVACKLHQLQSSWAEEKKRNYVKHAMREYEIHKELNHINIVRLRNVFEVDENTFCTVLDLCEGHDLDILLKTNRYLPEREARSISQQIASALAYLNRPGHPNIIHYDLKPANVLFDKQGVAKITDFGLSKILETQEGSLGMELTSQGAGTYWYLPPECFNMKEAPKVSSKVDVWSLGIVVYQMLFGVRPFGHNETQESILVNGTIAKAGELKFPPTPEVSEIAKDFMRKCLTNDQRKRPDVLTISNHPFVTYSSSA